MWRIISLVMWPNSLTSLRFTFFSVNCKSNHLIKSSWELNEVISDLEFSTLHLSHRNPQYSFIFVSFLVSFRFRRTGFMFCCSQLEFLSNIWMRILNFQFPLNPINYVAGTGFIQLNCMSLESHRLLYIPTKFFTV